MALTVRETLALLQVNGIGGRFVSRALRYSYESGQLFGSAAELCDLSKDFGKNVDLDEMTSALVKADEILYESDRKGVSVVMLGDDNFPSNLNFIVDGGGRDVSPLLLWYKGDISIAQMPSAALIGSRSTSEDAFREGTMLGTCMADAGINIVSGLALGCDTCAHLGALEASEGKTTAILGHGLDRIYPTDNAELAERILDKGGLLLSEYQVGLDVSAGRLVERDRLQSGLADAVCVIQMGCKGGTLHALRAAKANMRRIYAVPAFNKEIRSEGNRKLLSGGLNGITANPISLETTESAIFEIKRCAMNRDSRNAMVRNNGNLPL